MPAKSPRALASGPPKQNPCAEHRESSDVKQLWEMADFVRRLSRQLLFGKFSRAPLKLMRFEWRGEMAECEWMIRPPDPWDSDLPDEAARRNQTLQALCDALVIRE